MTDSHLRELERRFRASGSVEDEAAWLRARVQAGELEQSKLELAAYCGHAPAIRCLSEKELPRPPSSDQASRSAAMRYMGGFGFEHATPWNPSTSTYGEGFIWCLGLRQFSTKATVRSAVAVCHALVSTIAREDEGLLKGLAAAEDWTNPPSSAAGKHARAVADELAGRSRTIGPGAPSGSERFLLALVAATARAAATAPVGDRESQKSRTSVANATAVVLGLGWRLLSAWQHQSPGGGAFDPHQTSQETDQWAARRLSEIVEEEVVPYLLGYSDPVRERVEARQREAGRG